MDHKPYNHCIDINLWYFNTKHLQYYPSALNEVPFLCPSVLRVCGNEVETQEPVWHRPNAP